MNSKFLLFFRGTVMFFAGMAFEQHQFFLCVVCIFIAVFAHKVFEDE